MVALPCVRRSTAFTRPTSSATRERLGDVVVGAGLEADDLVELGVLRGEHQDVGVAELADAAADLDAVDVGQAEVEHDQVEVVQRGGADGGLAVGGLVDVEALLDEQRADEHPVLRGVVDDEGARGGDAGHGHPSDRQESPEVHGVELPACS